MAAVDSSGRRAASAAPLAELRAAGAAARTPAALDRLLDAVHAYGYANPEHAHAAADVAESIVAAREALEQLAPARPMRR